MTKNFKHFSDISRSIIQELVLTLNVINNAIKRCNAVFEEWEQNTQRTIHKQKNKRWYAILSIYLAFLEDKSVKNFKYILIVITHSILGKQVSSSTALIHKTEISSTYVHCTVRRMPSIEDINEIKTSSTFFASLPIN
jgi:hypothetical protein